MLDIDRDSFVENLEIIRTVVIDGLAAFGEVVRLENVVELEKLCGREVLPALVPVHPTGDAGTVAEFANALRNIETLLTVARRENGGSHG